MSTDTHKQLANFIWSICNLLRGPYKRNEYRKVILPLTVLKRFDSILTPTKGLVLAEAEKHRGNLQVQSRPGDTRFVVVLPLVAPAPESLV